MRCCLSYGWTRVPRSLLRTTTHHYRLMSRAEVDEALATKKRRMIRAYRWEDPPDDKIEECREFKQNLERPLHEFVNKHLKELFGLELIKSEFKIKSGSRADALAFDNDRKCFVIVEYKVEDYDRLARQITVYSTSHGQNFTTEYSKAQVKHPDRFPTPVHDINDDDRYILIVSARFPASLKNELSSAMKQEIHMYEIHLFDNVVVLRKIDDGCYWPRSAEHWGRQGKLDDFSANAGSLTLSTPVSIQQLSPTDVAKINPTILQFPDGTSTNVSKWISVMRKVAIWLHQNNYISSTEQSTLLTEIQPARQFVKLGNNLFINLNYTKAKMLNRIQKLIHHIGYMPGSFLVTLQDEGVETDKRSDKILDVFQHTMTDNSPAISIQDLDHLKIKRGKSIKLYFPDDTSTRLAGWAPMMRSVSQWLYDNGHITTTKQSDLLDADVPATAKGKPYNHVKLADNLFVNLNYTKSKTLTRIQKLLADVGYKPRDFAVVIQDERAGGDGQLDETVIEVHHATTGTPSSAISIQDLDYPKIKHAKPATLYFPDGTPTSPTGWVPLMREVVQWLYDRGHIVNSKQSSLLDAVVPTTSNGKPYNHIRLANNLFMNVNYNKKYTLQRLQKLLTDIGHEPDNFKITIEGE